MFAREPGSELVNLAVAGLLGQGMTLLGSGAQMPRRVRGWRLALPGDRTVRVAGPGGGVLYDGPCDQPAGWAGLVARSRWCVIPVGLYAAGDAAVTVGQLAGMLDGAWRLGALIGGLVRIGRG